MSALPQRIFMRACYIGCVRTIAEAVKMGCCDAAMYLGCYYKRKYDAPTALIDAKLSFNMAVEFLKTAALKGRTDAEHVLGVMLSEDNQKEGIKWLKLAALKGNQYSQFSLGRLYDISHNEEADHWYTLAAHRGHVEARYILACKAKLSNKHDVAVYWFRLVSPRLVIADENLLDLLANHPGLRQETEIEFFKANADCDRSTLRKRWLERKFKH